jgi:hypothetical protein
MFVRYYVELPLPFAEAEGRLIEDPASWMPGMAGEAGARGEELLVEVGFGPEGLRVHREVVVTVGEPVVYPSKTSVPIRWHSASAEGLFPALDADVEVGPMGPKRAQLAISARYQPPLGVVGNAIDRALLHRVAEGTVKDFLDRAAERIVARSAARGVAS